MSVVRRRIGNGSSAPQPEGDNTAVDSAEPPLVLLFAAKEVEPPPLPPIAPPTVGELLRMSDDRAVRDSHEKHFEEPEAAIAPTPEEARVEPPAAPPSAIDRDTEDEDEQESERADETPEPAAAEKLAPVLPPPPPQENEPPPAPLRLPEPEPPAPPAKADDEPVYDDLTDDPAELAMSRIGELLPATGTSAMV